MRLVTVVWDNNLISKKIFESLEKPINGYFQGVFAFWGRFINYHKILYFPPNYHRLSHEKYGLLKGVG